MSDLAAVLSLLVGYETFPRAAMFKQKSSRRKHRQARARHYLHYLLLVKAVSHLWPASSRLLLLLLLLQLLYRNLELPDFQSLLQHQVEDL